MYPKYNLIVFLTCPKPLSILYCSSDKIPSPNSSLASSFRRQSVLAMPVLMFFQQDRFFHSLLRAFAATAPFAWKEFPPDNCNAAFSPLSSLCSRITISVETYLTIPKCHLSLPYHPSLLYFPHSTYYYPAWYISYLLALSMSQLRKHVICLFTSKF